MHFVLLNILCWLIFTQTLRYAQHRRDAPDYVVGAVNYVFAAVLSLGALAALSALRGPPALTKAGLMGAACGVSYFGQFLMILAGYRLAGVGITMSVASIGVLVPVVLSWLVWGEAMTPWRWVAVGLLPLALLLVRPPARNQPGHLSWKADLLLAAVFLNGGLMTTLHKAVGIYAASARSAGTFLGFPPHQIVYLSGLFVTAAACSATYAIVRGGRCGAAALSMGAVAGSANVMGTLSMVAGVAAVGAVVFYPTLTCAVIVLSVVVSRALWGERVTGRQFAGLAAAAGIVVLANL